jgi:cell division protein FtsI (penicillin-binding protein 3)
MNINDPLHLDIKGETAPYIKNRSDKQWYGTTLPWMSIGYEVSMTPMQILAFYNAVANNGKLVKPRFVKALRYRGKIIKTFDTEVINPAICSIETIKKAKEMLNAVVDYGTAKNLKNDTYKIAGKTGTAQVANTKFGYKDKDKINYQASFAGYFPADNPKFSCIVVVSTPTNSVYYGNVVAGPVFKEIADKVNASCLEIHKAINETEDNIIVDLPSSKVAMKNDLDIVYKSLNIPITKESTTPWVGAISQNSTVKYQNRIIKDDFVPNVVGMGAKDALYILENRGLKVAMIGKGTVVQQSIEPGTEIKKGKEITIKLS